MNMSINLQEKPDGYDYEAAMTVAQLEQSIVNVLMTTFPEYASVMAGNKNPYLAGCLFGIIDWVGPMFPDIDIQEYAEASQLNAAFSGWYFKIGNSYYKMAFDADDKVEIENPCAFEEKEWIFRVSFQLVSYPSQS